MSPVADRPVSQPIRALKIAEQVRLQRASDKRRLREGRLTILDLLEAPEWQTCAVYDLLQLQPRFGHTRSLAVCNNLPCRTNKQLGELTGRQKQRLRAGIKAYRRGADHARAWRADV